VGERVEFRILGPLEVRIGGGTLALGGPRQRALLGLLLCNANRAVSRDRLIEELLGDQPSASAERMLRVQVSRLRHALGGDGDDQRLLARAPGYVLRVEDGELDLQTFERLLAEGTDALEREEARRAAELLREALALWRGRPLADLEFEPFARFEVQRLEELRLLAVEECMDAELALGRHAALVPELEALAEEHPLRERLRGQLMLALYRSGRQVDALERFRAGRSRLVAELALEPGPALRALEQAILDHDPKLEMPTRQAQTRAPPAAGSVTSLPPRPRRRRGSRAASVLLLVGAAAAVVAALTGGNASATVLPNSTAVINPRDDRVLADVPVGVAPDGIAAGAGGIWVANTADDTISDIDPATRAVTRTLSLSGSVDGVAASSGSLWTLDTSAGVAQRVDPMFGTVLRTVRLSPLHGTLLASPTAIAVGGGSAWFGDNAAAVVRVGGDGTVLSTTPIGNHPSGIAIGAGGTWITDSVDDTVSEIDASDGVATTIAVGQGASGIAIGRGAVWVADTLDDDVVRIDATTDSVATTIPVGAAPNGVAYGDGSVWVADGGDGTVARIDPTNDRVIATIHVGGSPQALVVADGRVWVTVQGNPPSPPAAGGPPGIVRIARERPFQSLDPALVSGFDQDEAQVMYETCAGLLSYPDLPGPAGGRLVPDVASLPSVSDGGRTYTFKIRRGFRFSPPSDAPVTAATFARTIERVLSHGVEGYERGFFTDIVGEPAFNAGKTQHIAGISTVGDRLEIRLRAPAPDLPARLAMLSFCAVPDDTPDLPLSHPIPSAGPYYIASSTPRQLVLERNPNYAGHRPRGPREIIYTFGQSYAGEVADVLAGRSDYVSTVQLQTDAPVPGALLASLAHRLGSGSRAALAGTQRFFVNPTATLYYFVLNTGSGPFSSSRVREAVNDAVSRQALVDAAGPVVGGDPISHYLPPAIPGSLPEPVYPPGTSDLQRARALMRGLKTHATLVTCNTEACTQTSQVLQQELLAIGITLDVVSLPIDVMATRLATDDGPWDIGWGSWSMDYADPSDYISGMFDPSLQLGLGNFDTPRWEAAIRRARTLSGPRRLAVYGRLDDALARDAAPAVPWQTQVARDLFSTRVGCEVYQPIYGMDLGRLCVR
jgi:YVTN family beta-propeller protein